MAEYDYSKLLGVMKEHGFTQEALAKAIGISECSLNLTLKNKRNFRQNEILIACQVLHIPTEDIDKYFFIRKL